SASRDEKRQRLVGYGIFWWRAENRPHRRHAAEHIAGVEAEVECHLPTAPHAVSHYARPVDRVLPQYGVHVAQHHLRLAGHPPLDVLRLRPHQDEVGTLAEFAEGAGHALAVLAPLSAGVEPDDQP